MEGNRIRETFLEFFEARGHRRVPSSSLIPPPESGLLLANAGMNQFIPYFLGQAEPPFRTATTVQKCFRANDIENVGHTARHLTMFEMLGNFSFGDYFKAEAIPWAHELVTEGFGIDHDRLWVTVYEEDAEAEAIWIDAAGVAPDRIVRRGRVDADGQLANYWHTHAAGPGGPCSEIFVDRGAKYGPDGGPDVDEERFMEIWNLVFIQEQVDKNLEIVSELPAKSIDTGASLERVATLLQGTDSYFETDLMRPLLEVVESMSGRTHGRDPRDDVSLKVIAEHGRATTFLIADGVQPSNQGRGYILRRMLRRVVSHARRLGIEGAVLPPLIELTAQRFGDVYPELRENEAFTLQVAASEEERFSATLRQGMALFDEARGRASEGRVSGEDAFKLSDTFGFPLPLTEEMAADAGLAVDTDRFAELLDQQRTRAREAAKKVAIGLDAGAVPPTEFVGYAQPEAGGRIVMLLDPENRELAGAEEGAEVRLFLSATPFYAESGGQVGDQGQIRTVTGSLRVSDAQWAGPHAIMHLGVVESGEIVAGQDATAEIDRGRRESTARAHTSTHVVHWTLKHLLGEHARQAGSLVAPGRLRFDFPHPSAVPLELLQEAELEANRRLARDDEIHVLETSMDEAKRLGAVALFGEKYGERVRVVEIGDYSRELCGGTHVERTGNVAIIRISHEGSIGAGMRRVEALVGPDALREINVERELLRGVIDALGVTDAKGAEDRARQLVERVKRLESEMGKLRKGDRESIAASLAESATAIDGVALVVSEVAGEDATGLRDLAQRVRDRLAGQGAAAVVLGGREGGKAQLVAACTGPAVALGVGAPALLEAAARAIGGGAGGKEILAMAGGRDAGAVGEALGGIPARLRELLHPN
ncbi:MAG: alanine--tRNA ligase [Actinomycetota bacterium]|nr:alanine--tRNA ligase [Actinomycetota bacterium]